MPTAPHLRHQSSFKKYVNSLPRSASENLRGCFGGARSPTRGGKVGLRWSVEELERQKRGRLDLIFEGGGEGVVLM